MMRVHQFLQDKEVRFETIVHPPAYTAQKRAKRLHISGKGLAKCVLLRKAKAYFLAVLPATSQVDLGRLSILMEQPVRLATANEVSEVFQDCEWGVAMPFGSLYGITTILDDSFAPDSVLVFEAHFHAFTIRMNCRDFERLEQPRRLRFAVSDSKVKSGKGT